MHEFIAAMRQFRRPIAALAIGILVLQALVAGLSTAVTAARAAGFDPGIICHGTDNGDLADPGSGSSPPAHDCCTYCTTAGPAALTPRLAAADRLEPVQSLAPPIAVRHIHPTPRAIRAGPSQAPPVVA